MIKKIFEIYQKYEEIFNYLIVGGLTTIVSLISFAFCNKLLNIDYITASIISWICAVTFAYFTNKIFVFKSKKEKLNENVIESIKFIASRVFSLLIDLGLMILLVETFKIDDLIAKIIVQFVIIVTNYVLSKLLVFKN